MTPSNTPITPQINNIADNGGNKHTVVPSNHTHSQSEVDGLTAALARKIGIVSSPTAGHLPKLKSDGALEDSGIPINNLAMQADLANINMSLAQKLGLFNMQQSVAGHLPVITSLGRLEDSGKGLSDLQTKLTFDTTPTANSNNPVTSGGVKTALDEKLDVKSQGVTIIKKTAQPITPRNMDSDMATLYERHYILKNTGITEPNVSDYFSSSDMTLHYSMDAHIKVPNAGWVAICVRRVQSLFVDNNLYITYEGTGRLS